MNDAESRLANDAERALRYLGNHRTLPGNRVELLVDGEQAYPSMLAAIAAAERSIVLESYIFRPDRAGRRFLAALVERAREGVSVRVLVDGVGARETPESFWHELVSHGGLVRVFNPVREVLPLGERLWVRDHRKLLVVDDAIGFIGGLNIGDDYAPVAWDGEAWHDVHARVTGPAAHELTAMFNRTWRQITKEDWTAHLGMVQTMGDTNIQVLEGRLTKRHSVRRAYLHAIHNAMKMIRITNAYCIPDGPVLKALHHARRRGVRVQLLLAGNTDTHSVQLAGRYLYRRLMSWGVEIYEWTDRVLHAKTAVIDKLWCSIGSYNLDRRSLLHNLEANIACVDVELGTALDAQFERDIARSTHIDPESWHRRPAFQKLLEMFFYQLRYLL